MMTTREATPRQRQIAEFIANLTQLDNAGRARLKRNAGRSLSEARDVQRVFYQIVPYGLAAYHEEDYFLIATLFPLAEARTDGVSLATTLRTVRQSRESASLDRRFQTLLDSEREHLPFRLRQAVRLAAATEQRIDWEQLLADLLAWEHPNRYVQLNWAKDYYVGHGSTETETR